jgi:nucleotidyltransferase/DNA polymerase involved in DNA repair
MTKSSSIKELLIIPGVGKSIANDLWNIGIKSVNDLKGKDPEILYDMSNAFAGVVQDRCLLYVFRGAVYYAETPTEKQDPQKLKWWNWKDNLSGKKITRLNSI